jgi:hypothetical protein
MWIQNWYIHCYIKFIYSWEERNMKHKRRRRHPTWVIMFPPAAQVMMMAMTNSPSPLVLKVSVEHPDNWYCTAPVVSRTIANHWILFKGLPSTVTFALICIHIYVWLRVLVCEKQQNRKWNDKTIRHRLPPHPVHIHTPPMSITVRSATATILMFNNNWKAEFDKCWSAMNDKLFCAKNTNPGTAYLIRETD